MEQVNPNALGAPAEGFGQTVSFAFDPRGEVPQQRPITSRPSNGGFSGGMQRRASDPNAAQQEPVRADPTGALLLKVGNEIMSRKLDEQRTVKFVEGMQRAMNGAAITDVVAEVPWYAKLFGDTPMIEGARAYTASTKVNDAVAQQVSSMGQLETMNGADAAKHFTGVVNSALTGDAGTDAVIMKGMTEQLPGLMKAQAKAHYAHGQRTASAAMGANITSGAKALQSYGELHADDKVNAADMKIAKDAFVRGSLPPDGVDEDNYIKTLVGSMHLMAQTGQFHAVEALRESAVMMALPADKAAALDKAIMTAATKHRDNYALTFIGEMAALKSDAATGVAGGDVSDIKRRLEGMNSKYQRLSGSPVGLYSSDHMADMLAGTFNALKAEKVRAATATATMARADASDADKEAAVAALDQSVTALVLSGDFPALRLLSGVSSDMVDRKVLELNSSNPAKGGEILANAWLKGDYVNDVIKQQLQEPMRSAAGSEGPTDGWFRSVDLFKKLKEGPGGAPYAAAYFGEHAQGLHRAVTMMGTQGIAHSEIGRIFQSTVRGVAERRDAPMTKEVRADLISKVADLNSNALVRKYLGKTKLRQDTLDLMSDVAANSTEAWIAAGMSNTEAVAMAVADVSTTGKLEVVGGFAIENKDRRPDGKPPAQLKDLASSLAHTVSTDKAGEYFEGFMRAHKGIPTDGQIKIMRVGEVAGATHYRVSHMLDGVASTYQFTSAEWSAYAVHRNQQDTKPSKPTRWAWGPPVVYSSSDVEGIAAQRAYTAAQRRAAEELKANPPVKK